MRGNRVELGKLNGLHGHSGNRQKS
jgi:hypothetical protein